MGSKIEMKPWSKEVKINSFGYRKVGRAITQLWEAKEK